MHLGEDYTGVSGWIIMGGSYCEPENHNRKEYGHGTYP